MTLLAPTLEAFFTERLMTQRQASPHTIAGYRDTMRLLLASPPQRTGKPPSKLEVADLDVRADQRVPRPPRTRTRQQRHAPATCAWRRSGRCSDTRRSRHPEHADVIAARARDPRQTVRPRAHHVPHQGRGQRAARRARSQHLDRPARPRAAADRDPDRAARLRADRAPLPRHAPRHRRRYLSTASGRTANNAPSRSPRQTVKALTVWLKERHGEPEEPLFPSNRGGRLSRDAVEWLIDKHTEDRRRALPDAPHQAGHRPRPAAHDRDDAAAIRDQHP